MMKKRILIIHPSMEIGGAERALLGLLDSMDYSQYSIDLLLCRHQGDFMPLIPTEVNLFTYDKRYDFFQCPVSQLITNGQWCKAFLRVLAKKMELHQTKKHKLPHSVWHTQQIIHNLIAPYIPKVNGEYDLAINFLGIPSILAKKVNAKVKVTWIHTDYSRIVADPNLDRKMYDKMDWIVNVSDDCKRIFDSFYPEYSSKSIKIENILSSELIHKLAEEDVAGLPFTSEKTNLLSIGRFGEAKNFDNIPEICRIVVDNGIDNFRWYLIGYGGYEQLIRENIKKFRVEDYVKILGKKTNPYPYIKACDIYLQPSRFEGKAVTVREAQILGKPVIVTAYETASSQIQNGIDGIILPMATTSFASALTDVLRDGSILKSVADFCKSQSYDNKNEIENIYKMI